MRTFLSAVTVGSALLLASPLVAAQANGAASDPQRIEAARDLYREGVAAFRAQRFGDAVLFFERSYRLRPHPTTLYNAAEARFRAGDRERAIEQLREMLALREPAPDEGTVERARQLAREGGVNNLEPAWPSGRMPVPNPEATSATPCPTCPECPSGVTTAAAPDRGALPWVTAALGVGLLGTGAAFYAISINDSLIYNRPDTSLSLRQDVKDDGELFRWLGIGGAALGVGVSALAVYLLVRPMTPPPGAAAPRARLQLGLGTVGITGTF